MRCNRGSRAQPSSRSVPLPSPHLAVELRKFLPSTFTSPHQFVSTFPCPSSTTPPLVRRVSPAFASPFAPSHPPRRSDPSLLPQRHRPSSNALYSAQSCTSDKLHLSLASFLNAHHSTVVSLAIADSSSPSIPPIHARTNPPTRASEKPPTFPSSRQNTLSSMSSPTAFEGLGLNFAPPPNDEVLTPSSSSSSAVGHSLVHRASPTPSVSNSDPFDSQHRSLSSQSGTSPRITTRPLSPLGLSESQSSLSSRLTASQISVSHLRCLWPLRLRGVTRGS